MREQKCVVLYDVFFSGRMQCCICYMCCRFRYNNKTSQIKSSNNSSNNKENNKSKQVNHLLK